ncbi:MAG: hypothetical protein IJI57_16210 [Flexilinea sp.]|nr:hypothetical protein [Flexilinea sp.]
MSNFRKTSRLRLILLFFAEIFILILGFLRMSQGIRKLTPVDISVTDWTCPYSVYHDGAFSVEDSLLNSGEETIFLYGPGLPLKKGTYAASIQYEAERDQYCEASGANIDNFMIIPADFVKGSRGILSSSKDSITYRFEVPEDVQKFSLSIHYNGEGSFKVKNISINQTGTWYRRTAANLFFIFLFLDAVYFFRHCPKQTQKTILLILGISFAASVPLFFRLVGNDNPGDMDFHMLRIDAAANALRDRQYPPRISALWMDGYGFPTSIYYNDILLLLPALLRILGYDLIVSMKVYLIFINILTTSLSLWAFSRLFNSRKIGILLAITYVLAPYRLSYGYVHSAVGEFSAITFLPLIAYGMLKIYTDNPDNWKSYHKYGMILALGITGVAAAHVLTLVISAFFIALACLVLFGKTFRRNTLRLWIDTVLLALVLNAYFLIPFADYYFNMETLISQNAMIRGHALMQNYGISLGRLLSFFPSSYQFGIIRVLSPGIVLMTAFAAGIYQWTKSHDRKLLLYLIFSGIALFMTMDCFPWNFLEMHTFLGNVMAQMQYPFRILVAANVLLCLVLGEVCQVYESENQTLFKSVEKGILLLNFIFLVFFVSDFSTGKAMLKKYETEALDTFATSLHYLPAGASTDRYAYTNDILTDGVEQVQALSRTTHTARYSVKSENGGSLEIPVLNYRGYHAVDSAGKEIPIQNGTNCRIRVEIPAGFDDVLTVEFKEPWYWRAAIALSAAGVLLWLITQSKAKRH